ncbi:MAG: M42 family peptidase, partial [Phycisphaerae bacterium]
MQLLKRLCETPGVSGFEREVQGIVIGELERSCDDVHTDRVGNVIGRKKAVKRASRKKPLKIMFAAHVDEIGFMVRHIDDDGFISFAPIGGFDPRLLLGRRVLVHGRKDVRGVIAPQPGCILTAEDKKKIVEIKDMVIDVAMPAEKVNKLVCVGDVISLDQDFRRLNDKVVTGRNFDDRVGVYCMLEAMKRIADNRAEVYAVSTVQEEVGLRGVPAAAFSVEPDIGIAIDGSLASDVPYASAKDKNCFLG